MTNESTICFVDVGQGHAAVVEDGTSVAVVDCPLAGAPLVVSRIAGAEHVDVFVTHRDLDHCGGIPKIIEQSRVRRLLMNLSYALPPDSDSYPRVKAVLSAIFDRCDRLGVDIETATYQGTGGSVGPDVTWEVLWPTSRVGATASLNNTTNHASLVIRFATQNTSALITGDIDGPAIKALLNSDIDLSSDILQLPHHGARNPQVADLLQAVRPSITNVSFGRANGYGHPAPEVLAAAAAVSQVLCNQVAHCCDDSPGSNSECAGSVTVALNNTLKTTTETADHQARVGTLQTPVCLEPSL